MLEFYILNKESILKIKYTIHTCSRSNREIGLTDRIHLLALVAVPLFRKITLLDATQVEPFPLTVQILAKHHVSIWSLSAIAELVILRIVIKIVFFLLCVCCWNCHTLFSLLQVIYQILNRHLLESCLLYFLRSKFLKNLCLDLSLQNVEILSHCWSQLRSYGRLLSCIS